MLDFIFDNVLLSVVIFTVALMVIGVVITLSYMTWKEKLPVKSSLAKVISKHQESNTWGSSAFVSTDIKCFLTFELLDESRRINLEVPSATYNVTLEGDIGVLEYKLVGNLEDFVAFTLPSA